MLIGDKIFNEVKNEHLGVDGFHLAQQKILFNLKNTDNNKPDKLELHSRRYIGNKAKLGSWIMKIIDRETTGNETFIDVFSGTGIIAREAIENYKNVVVNDILHSNYFIYQAVFNNKKWREKKILKIAKNYNELNGEKIKSNYFSKNYGGKFFEKKLAKIIGFIREDIETRKDKLNSREYAILLAFLIYSIDRHANTVGHFDAYIKKSIKTQPLNFRLIKCLNPPSVKIYREDANELVKRLRGDIAYIDPPYNSRQYSRFYHVYENLIQWKKPKLYGVALKPKPENMSQYCTVKAKNAFKDLVENLNVNYLAVSYNNTYKSKSKSSENKIKFDEIVRILNGVGETKIFKKPYKYFNTGKTDFNNHKEFLFLTKKHE